MKLDSFGRIIGTVDYKGREVNYELGKMGERTKIVYPDGKETRYFYDSNLRLSRLTDGESQVDYSYDGSSRIREKECSNGMSTIYSYDRAGNLAELIHKDSRGIFDRYSYQYDAMGNRTQVEKYRRGLREESGEYGYTYDALSRLTGVEKDREFLRSYEYDGFGNRTCKREGEEETNYHYNAFNQLVMETDHSNTRNFTYDRRGNLTKIMENGKQSKAYEFSPYNRMTKAWNEKNQKAVYEYNGLGHRVGKQVEGTGTIEYILDFTKNYYNLLQKEENGEVQSYIWDSNLVSTEVDNRKVYYFQDNLGSPIRLVYGSRETAEVYGYDEFGNDLYGNQGDLQPFGYTGYQMDEVSGTYFAQAREYSSQFGIFNGEDVDKGELFFLLSLNKYHYCLNNPMKYIDLDGEKSEIPEYILVLLEQGNEAHTLLRAKAQKTPGVKGQYYIQSGLKKGNGSGYSTPSGTGYADFVYFNGNTVEVYELKNNSVHGMTSGPKQLNAYVNALRSNNQLPPVLMPTVTHGTSLQSVFNTTNTKQIISRQTDCLYYQSNASRNDLLSICR